MRNCPNLQAKNFKLNYVVMKQKTVKFAFQLY